LRLDADDILVVEGLDGLRGLAFAALPLAASLLAAMPLLGMGFLGIGATGVVAATGELLRHAAARGT